MNRLLITSTGVTNSTICTQLPMAMPSDMSIRSLRAIEIAEKLSAAPPTTARITMPMNAGESPSAWPVPSAAPTRISLIHAASTEAPTSIPTARTSFGFGPSCS